MDGLVRLCHAMRRRPSVVKSETIEEAVRPPCVVISSIWVHECSGCGTVSGGPSGGDSRVHTWSESVVIRSSLVSLWSFASRFSSASERTCRDGSADERP